MKKYRRILFNLMIMVVLASCKTSQQGVQTTERLQSVEVTPTESLLFPYLESILIQENDLPPGYSAGKISHKFPTYYEKIVAPDADYVIRLQIQKESVSGGQVMVFYYAIQEVTQFAFDSIAGDMRDARMLEGVGEMAKIEIASAIQATSQNLVGIVFIQCHAVVHISLLGTDDEQAVTTYAERLSKRLETVVCE